MDSRQYHLHVCLVLDVPLGSGSTLRIQCRSLRQPQYVGANRQRGSIHTDKEIPACGSHSGVPAQHSLHALRLDLFHYQFPCCLTRCDTQITLCKSKIFLRWRFLQNNRAPCRVIGCEWDFCLRTWRIEKGQDAYSIWRWFGSRWNRKTCSESPLVLAVLAR